MISATHIFYFCKLYSLCIWHFSTIQSAKTKSQKEKRLPGNPLMMWQDTCISGATTAATTKLREG